RLGIVLANGSELRSPVLVDPLTGKVHRLEARGDGKGNLALGCVPLTSYPLLITDLGAIPVRPPTE
ncbi:MAG: hypothetical protein JXR77_17360, partial [Lentisphaeria bacterium]|nr:hypothetical protein [Lentisphaeria bacterium]